jgi:hypothetical protein
MQLPPQYCLRIRGKQEQALTMTLIMVQMVNCYGDFSKQWIKELWFRQRHSGSMMQSVKKLFLIQFKIKLSI